MRASEILKAAKALPFKERIELAQELWDDINGNGYEPEITPHEIAEIDRRAEEALKHPERCRPLEDVLSDLDKRLRAKG